MRHIFVFVLMYERLLSGQEFFDLESNRFAVIISQIAIAERSPAMAKARTEGFHPLRVW